MAPGKEEKEAAEVSKTDQKEPEAPKELTVLQNVQRVFALLDSAVSLFEPRFTQRALRILALIRKKLNVEQVTDILDVAYPANSQQKATLLSLLPDKDSGMQVDSEAKAKPAPPTEILPEVDIYVTLVVLVFLLDQNKVEQGLALSDHTVARLQNLNRRTLDQLAAKVFFYYSRFHELHGLDSLVSIRPTLLAAQQTASLRHDWESLATLLNLVLRNYYSQNLYDQADKFISKVKFPEGANNNQLARWYFYVGRLRAIQLKYTEAHTLLQSAIRRSPQPTHAPGFYQTAHKLSIVVELLMGDIPERSLFRQQVLAKTLQPYLAIVQSVRVGDLQAFTTQLAASATQFRQDGTYTLIARLRHNVIKTALRTISLAYSRIPLRDICTKLGLDSEEEVEYIVAKAIRDGVLEASLDHEKGHMMSNEVKDVYSTAEPMRAFDERIRFCLNLRNDSVKAMRYPLHTGKDEKEDADEAREREKEIVQDLLDEDEPELDAF